MLFVEILAVLLPDSAHLVDDIVNVENHLHHADLLVINIGIEFCLYLRFTYVINRKSKLDSCQRTCVGGVTVGDRLSSESGSLAFSCAQENYYVLGAVLIGEFLDALLVFQIHCACGRSDKALGGGEYYFCASGFSAGSYRLSRYTVAVAYDHAFLTG